MVDPQEQLRIATGSPRPSLRARVFLELFCGCAAMSRAICGAGGFVLCWDFSLGPKYDLTIASRRRLVFGWIRAGLVWGSHLGTDCRSWSRARDNGKNGWPGPLRSDTQVMGLDGLSDKDQLKVQLGNTLMIFSFAVLTLCHRLSLPATMENPGRSRIWLTPQCIQLRRLPRFTEAVCHYCQYGMRWKKETRFIGVNISLHCIEKRCSGGRLCSTTGLPHVILSGIDPSTGKWKTSFGNAYPRPLCRLLAAAFYDADAVVFSQRMSKLVA